MNNYTTVTVEGNVTQDPTLRKTKTGKLVCIFSVATNYFSKATGENKVSYVDIETWEKLAELCGESVTRGRHVIVFGVIRQDRWVGTDEKKHSRLKVVGREIKFLESHQKEAPSELKKAG